MAIMSIMTALAIPNLSSMRDQMDVSEAKYQIGHTLGEVRAEAIRLKASIQVSFTSNAMRWDIFQDGSIDGSVSLPEGVAWHGGTPSSIIFDGLGIARSITATQTVTVKRGTKNDTIQLNKNGYISL